GQRIIPDAPTPPAEKKFCEGCVLLVPKQSALQQCIVRLRAKAKEFREVFGDEGRARTLEWAARKVQQALRDENEDLLTLPEAAQVSGYHPDSLARMVRDGQITDLRPPGSKGMIRIRRGDLPIKPGKPHTPSADVRELASRLGIRGTGGPHGHP